MAASLFHKQSSHQPPRRAALMLALLLPVVWARPVAATDYFLTIGGGYNRSGNQASLEANVVFFQQVLAEKHRGSRRHDIYFADGHDAGADLQVMAEKPVPGKAPATELLTALHRRPGQLDVTYRNHRVPQISGALDPALIRADLEALSRTTRAGDRLIIYVTAHGSGGPDNDEYNTTIDCWNERKITAREFTEWLGKFPANVPVVMVMAQCYSGGFAHTIFQGLDEAKGLAPQLRAGFFAQQHDLPAAGCRPDIEHDEEFSSYFWGALAGRSRNGVPIRDCDADGNGVISFAEAYAYAVIAGETIDIPVRTSEVLLRTYSRLTNEPTKEAAAGETKSNGDSAEPATTAPPLVDAAKDRPPLATMSGTLESFVARARPVSARIVTQLSATLGFALGDDVKSVQTAAEEHRRAGRFAGRGRGRRPGSGRRELLREVTEKWPELGDARKWQESAVLKSANQEQLAAEIKQLPSWAAYEERLKQSATTDRESDSNELRGVKFRRLIAALEAIVLEQNLSQVASPEIVGRYQQLLALEESSLSPAPSAPTRRN